MEPNFKWQWRLIGVTGINISWLIWLWVAKLGGTSRLNWHLSVFMALTVGYGLALVTPFILATTNHWNAWQVATHWAIGWLAYGPLVIAWSNGLKLPAQPIVGMGGLVSVVGVLCVDARPNSVLGVRNVWTYQSATIWRKTNTLTGWCFLISGELGLVLSYWWPMGGHPFLVLALTLITVGVTTGYAYLLAHQSNLD